MFCPNCGKKVNDFDNFCKFCGHDLRESEKSVESYLTSEAAESKAPISYSVDENSQAESVSSPKTVVQQDEPAPVEEKPVNDDEEIVVYEIKKHAMSLFWPCVFSPIFLAYFWIFYVNIPSIIGFIIALIVLAPIVYPILRYFSDRSVVTTSSLHIRQGVFNVEDICIPLKKIHLVRLRRSFLGRIADYGHLVIEKENSDKEIVYRYIQDPEDVEFILNNTQAYIKEYMKS